MSQLKHIAVLRGDVLQDVATGQMFMLHPTDEDRQRGVWEYNEEADGHRWHYIVVNDVTYAVNGCYLEWEGDMEEWNQEEMGQWPFGNRLTEEELYNREVEDVLFELEYYLEAELEWMDRMEDEENEESDDLDDDSYIDDVSEDEGYDTSPEVDFEQFDYWALVTYGELTYTRNVMMGFGSSSCKILLINCLHYDFERCNYDLTMIS